MKYRAFASLAVLSLGGCSYETVKTDVPQSSSPDAAFDAIKADVDRECGRCHNGSTHPKTFESGAKFKSSTALQRIENNTMPPDRPMDAAVKAKMVDYLR